MKTLGHVSTEMSLHVLAYNLKRVIGIFTANSDGHNSVLQIAPESAGRFARYDKVRLMPFGEYRQQDSAGTHDRSALRSRT